MKHGVLSMIDLTVHPQQLERAVQRARENRIVIPTFAQMRDPALIPEAIKKQLRHVGLWDVNPLNLFRISWHNEPTMSGGAYGPVNFIELPSVLTGVKARIIVLCGKWLSQRRGDQRDPRHRQTHHAFPLACEFPQPP